MMVVLDTSFLIDVLRMNSEAMDELGHMLTSGTSMVVPAICVMELFQGIVRAGRPESERSQVLRTLGEMEIQQMDFSIASAAGEIQGELLLRGELIQPEDCMVAATALQLRQPVLTKDRDHFERVPGLEVLTW